MQGMRRFANSFPSVFSLLTSEKKKQKKSTTKSELSEKLQFAICLSPFVDNIDANAAGPVFLLFSSTETDLNYTETNIGSFGYTWPVAE